jgi:hypothetical protein
MHTHVFEEEPPAASSALPLLPSVPLHLLPSSLSSASASIATDAAAAALSHLLPPARLAAVEADAFWAFSWLLGRIQDNYVPSQPGIAHQVRALDALLATLDPELAEHLEEQGVQTVQFAFRWFNCLLLREVALARVPRLWDAALSTDSAEAFASLHVHLAAALMLRWREQILAQQAHDVIGVLQRLPTQRWTDADVETLLAEAFVHQTQAQAQGKAEDKPARGAA